MARGMEGRHDAFPRETPAERIANTRAREAEHGQAGESG